MLTKWCHAPFKSFYIYIFLRLQSTSLFFLLHMCLAIPSIPLFYYFSSFSVSASLETQGQLGSYGGCPNSIQSKKDYQRLALFLHDPGNMSSLSKNFPTETQMTVGLMEAQEREACVDSFLPSPSQTTKYSWEFSRSVENNMIWVSKSDVILLDLWKLVVRYEFSHLVTTSGREFQFSPEFGGALLAQ